MGRAALPWRIAGYLRASHLDLPRGRFGRPMDAARVRFLQQGLVHAEQCAATAGVVNDASTSMAEKKAAIADLVNVRRSLEHTNVANMDRAAIIEADSWKELEGLFEP